MLLGAAFVNPGMSERVTCVMMSPHHGAMTGIVIKLVGKETEV